MRTLRCTYAVGRVTTSTHYTPRHAGRQQCCVFLISPLPFFYEGGGNQETITRATLFSCNATTFLISPTTKKPACPYLLFFFFFFLLLPTIHMDGVKEETLRVPFIDCLVFLFSPCCFSTPPLQLQQHNTTTRS